MEPLIIGPQRRETETSYVNKFSEDLAGKSGAASRQSLMWLVFTESW